jgi:hypothetical protein
MLRYDHRADSPILLHEAGDEQRKKGHGMALDRSRREAACEEERQLGRSRANVRDAEQLDPRFGIQPAAEVGPSQMLDRARGSGANGHGPKPGTVQLGHKRGDIEKPVHRIPRASMGELEGEMRRGGQASTNVPQPDAGRR